MHNIVIQRADEMPPPLKAAVEQMLGRLIDADEEISILASPPQQAAPHESKASAVRTLEALLDRRAAKVDDIPEDEINALIDEAVSQARHNRK